MFIQLWCDDMLQQQIATFLLQLSQSDIFQMPIRCIAVFS